VSRLAKCFEILKEQGKKAVIPYIVAGDPRKDVTVPMMHELVSQGASIIELGVPFSDPMAEGPVIQLAHERALAHGTSLRDSLAMAREFRASDATTPIVLMGYANPVEAMGYRAFADAAAEAGIDGLITVDMPPEEVGDLNIELIRVGIDNIFLIAPTTTSERIKMIADSASGFLYYVSLKGVTGSASLNVAAVAEACAKIRGVSTLPLAVGFGIKDAQSACAIGQTADAVIVGSALVNAMAAESGDDLQLLCKNSAKLIGDIKKALDAL
jgi:tryptophan synthase alpha chain